MQANKKLMFVVIDDDDDDDDVDDNDDIRIYYQSDNKTTTLHVHHGLCTFLCRRCTAWKCRSSSFMEVANKRRRIFLSLSKLECGLHEIASKEIRLHWTFSANSSNVPRFEKTRFHFKSDVFTVVTAVDAKAPYSQRYSGGCMATFTQLIYTPVDFYH